MAYKNPSRYAKVGAFGVAHMAGANMARAFAIAASRAMVQSTEGLEETLQQLAEGGNRASKMMENKYPIIAAKAKQAALDALGETVTGQYRTGDRRVSGKKLEQAVKEFSFIPGKHGVRMINKKGMNETAVQWYRINFGALPRGKGVNRAWALRVGNTTVGELSMIGRPDNEMLMPQGGFYDASGKSVPRSVGRRGRGKRGGQDRLILKPRTSKRSRPMIRTQGMEARDFLGEGARVMARELGRSISLAMDEVNGKRLRTQVRTVKVRA